MAAQNRGRLRDGDNAVYWRHAVGFKWAAGDVLAMDNEMAMHARTSFEPPRKIVVGFSKV